MKGNIREILNYLYGKQIRATYTAVQSYLGFGVLDKVNWEEILGPHRQYTSWVVNKKTGLPNDYNEADIDPNLLRTSKIITKGKQLQLAVDEYNNLIKANPLPNIVSSNKKMKIKVADCHGNNCAVICPSCKQAYVVSGFLNKGIRKCPHCEKSTAIFTKAKAEWEITNQNALINSAQTATRLIFKKEWLGYDVWVTFTEDDVTYKYPHDQLLQTFISRLRIIQGTKSWEEKGLYHFPRLSGEQKKLLQRYIIQTEQIITSLPSDSITEREWNFRDDNNQNFYGDIPKRQPIITLTLNWKPNKISVAKLVGKYEINLRSLLFKGYVEENNRGIRLRFQRTGNIIEIAIGPNHPALIIGRKPE